MMTNVVQLRPMQPVLLSADPAQIETLSRALRMIDAARISAGRIAAERHISNGDELERVALKAVQDAAGVNVATARRAIRAAALAMSASGREFRPIWSSAPEPSTSAYVTVARTGWGVVKIDLPDDGALLVRFESAQLASVRFAAGHVSNFAPVIDGRTVTARLPGDYETQRRQYAACPLRQAPRPVF